MALYDWIGAGRVDPKNKVKVPPCGACHPGGAAMEFPRKTDGTADYTTDLIDAEKRNQDSLDGDFYSRFTPDHKSHFLESGLLEADCMICHSRGYQFGARLQQIIARNYRWAATAGAGWGKVAGRIFTFSSANARPGDEDFWAGSWNFQTRPVVAYDWQASSLFTAEGKLKGSLIRKMVPSGNCLQCHTGPDTKKVGWIHDAKFDVHAKAGFECTDCHGLVGKTKKERLQHQIAKGWHTLDSVRDDLDGQGMQTCEGCHLEGKYQPKRSSLPRAATDPTDTHNEKYEDLEFHFEMISCVACHSTRQPGMGGYLIDMSTGSQIWYTAATLETIVWAGDFGLPAPKPWQPWITQQSPGKGKAEQYVPIVPQSAQWFGEKMVGDEVRPIPLALVKKAFKRVASQITQVKVKRTDGETVTRRTVATDQDIIAMLSQLAKNGHQRVVFVRDKIYQLKNGKLDSYEDFHTAHTHNFPIHHNVIPISAETALGHAGAPDGCADCHSKTASFFSKMIINDVGGYLKDSYPIPRKPYAIPTFEKLGLEEIPESGMEDE